MRRMFLIFSLLTLFTTPSYASFKDELHLIVKKHHTNPITSYKKARRVLFGDLHLKNGEVKDVYCNKTFDHYDGVGKDQIPNHQLLNCEHTHPQSKFNSRFPTEYQRNDLHHLYPAYSKANSTRSNLPFGEVNGKPANNCADSLIGTIDGTNQKGFEPPETHKGNVARALFYFSVRYDVAIPDYEEKFLRQWHLSDPVDQDEKDRDARIAEIQGNHNPFVVEPSLVNEIDNF